MQPCHLLASGFTSSGGGSVQEWQREQARLEAARLGVAESIDTSPHGAHHLHPFVLSLIARYLLMAVGIRCDHQAETLQQQVISGKDAPCLVCLMAHLTAGQ